MAKKLPDPTEAELTILQVLWRRGPSSVREVWHDLGEKSGYTTVLKFLQIMHAKGLVRRDEQRRVKRCESSQDYVPDSSLRYIINILW